MLLTLTVPALSSAAGGRTLPEILAASSPSDWRRVNPENEVYLELTAGRVVIELAEKHAPRHVANIKALVREGYFDGLAIIRVQDNYVVQWGDPDNKRPIRRAQRNLAAEFTRSATGMQFMPLAD